MNSENQSLERQGENMDFCQSCEQRGQLLDQIHEATSDSILKVFEQIAERVSWHFLFVGMFITIFHLAIPFYIFGLHIFSLICWSISLLSLIISSGIRAIKSSQEKKS